MQSKKTDQQTDCPDTQEFTAFVEGKLDLQHRSRILQHIKTCNECRQLAADAVSLRRDLPADVLDMEADHLNQPPLVHENERSRPFRAKKIVRLRAAAIALPVAAVFLMVALLSPDSDWSSEQILNPLKNETEIQKIIQSITLDETRSAGLGFSKGITNQKAAFQTGILLSQLEICRKAKNYEKGKYLSKNLVDIMKRISLQQSTQLIGKLEANSSQPGSEDQLVDIIKTAEAIFLNTPFDFYLKFGLVVETGKLFSRVGKSEFFDQDYIEYILTQPEFHKLPPGVTLRIKEVSVLLANNSIAQNHEIIYNLLQEIERILI